MANTLGTVNAEVIAMESLTTLLDQLPFLNSISKRFTDQRVKKGKSLDLHIVSATSAKDFVPANGYVADDQTQVDVKIPLDQHKYVSYKITGNERDSTDIDLIKRFANVNAHALGKAIVTYLLSLYTVAAGAVGTVKAVGSWDRAALIDVTVAMDTAKIPSVGRFGLLSPTYHGALRKDGGIVYVQNNANAEQFITDGTLGRIEGVDLFKYTAMPKTAGPDFIEGIFGVPEAIGLITAVPGMPSDPSIVPGSITYVTEPNSGLTVQLRKSYDMDLDEEKVVMTLYFGGKITDFAKLHALKSA
jgi:hypothetical protein